MKINEIYQPVEEISKLDIAKKSFFTARELDVKWMDAKADATIYKSKLYPDLNLAIREGNGWLEVYLFNSKNTRRPLAYVELHQKKKAWQTSLASVRESAMGAGFGYKIYVMLIKEHDLILVSDDQQSVGGQKIWYKLYKTPGITLYGWDQRAPKGRQFFQVHDYDGDGNLEAADRRLYKDPEETIPGRISDPATKKELSDKTKAAPRLLVAVKSKR